MVHAERTEDGLPFRDTDVSRPIMAEQHHIILEVHQIEFTERPAGAKGIHDLHRLHVLHFAFPGNRNMVCGEE